VVNEFKNDIREDIELERKYNTLHTEEEINYRKEIQSKFLFFHKQKNSNKFYGLRRTWNWLRNNYFNFKVKENIDRYEYSKNLKSEFAKIILIGMTRASVLTFFFFVWMRLIKHKGKKDFFYLFLINGVFTITMFSAGCYEILIRSRLPLNKYDLGLRKELLEDFVLGSNRSMCLTEEIKKISKFYLPEKIEFSTVTSLGQKITFITQKGRLYVSCDNYAEVFGYSAKNKLAKMKSLNIFVLREREIIYCLFRFYDTMISEYIKKYQILETYINYETKIIQDLIDRNEISEKHLEYMKNNRYLTNVQFHLLKFEKPENINANIQIQNNSSKNINNSKSQHDIASDYMNFSEKSNGDEKNITYKSPTKKTNDIPKKFYI
jgi:hypothetical protein